MNYWASAGYGLDFMRAVEGKSGIVDVEDCGEILLKTLEQYKDEIDETWVAVYGGSHGGFLTCWLTGHPKYSKLFKAAAQWNPVTDYLASTYFTDITDWNFAEALGWDLDWNLSEEDAVRMRAQSPSSVAHNITCPTLFIIGAKDLWVPPG